jgi:hypothetical protein
MACAVIVARSGAQACDAIGAVGCERILDAMMLVRREVLLRLSAASRSLGVDSGLRQARLWRRLPLRATGEGCHSRRQNLLRVELGKVSAGSVSDRGATVSLQEERYQRAMPTIVVSPKSSGLFQRVCKNRLSVAFRVGMIHLAGNQDDSYRRPGLFVRLRPASVRQAYGHLNVGVKTKGQSRAIRGDSDCKAVGIDCIERIESASSKISTARMRSTISSSTTRTIGERRYWTDDMAGTFH